MQESIDITRRRLSMRSMRRGMKEMDLILEAYAAKRLPYMERAELDLYDALLSENDQDLYQWVSGQEAAPEQFAALIRDISDSTLGTVRS